MATDIHICVEIKESESAQWVSLTPEDFSLLRFYSLFNLMAAGRSENDDDALYPIRGLPNDATPATVKCLNSWQLDAHNVSWLSACDFQKCLQTARSAFLNVNSMSDYERNTLFEYDTLLDALLLLNIRCGASRIVFWFDN